MVVAVYSPELSGSLWHLVTFILSCLLGCPLFRVFGLEKFSKSHGLLKGLNPASVRPSWHCQTPSWCSPSKWLPGFTNEILAEYVLMSWTSASAAVKSLWSKFRCSDSFLMCFIDRERTRHACLASSSFSALKASLSDWPRAWLGTKKYRYSIPGHQITEILSPIYMLYKIYDIIYHHTYHNHNNIEASIIYAFHKVPKTMASKCFGISQVEVNPSKQNSQPLGLRCRETHGELFHLKGWVVTCQKARSNEGKKNTQQETK